MPLPPVAPIMAPAKSSGTGLISTALPLLRAEEEPVLGFWIEAGQLAAAELDTTTDPTRRAALTQVRLLGEQSMERMTRSNIRLVYHWISRCWTGRDTGGLDVEDLAAVGIEGLIRALRMWDYRRGLKFSTYATWWIRQHLDRAVIRARGLHPGALDTLRLEELFRARTTLEIQHARAATIAELSQALQISPPAVKDLLLLERNVRSMIRLDAPVDDTARSTTLGDFLLADGPTPEEIVEDGERHAELAAALQELSPRERAVLTARVGWSGPVESEDAVAARFGVTPAQVRATTVAGLARMRALLGPAASLEAAA